MSLVFISWIFTLVSLCSVKCDHFRSGTVTWGPTDRYNETFKEIKFTFRFSWAHSFSPCDDKTIKSGQLIGNTVQKWVCQSGCQGTVGPTGVRCTGYNRPFNHSTGSNHFTFVFSGDGLFTIASSSCCWMGSNSGNWSRWNLTTQLLLGIRNDTNSTNFAPIVRSPLILRLYRGIADVIDLNVYDTDNDVIRCRPGLFREECGDVCELSRGFFLDREACRILYRPGENSTLGTFPIAIFVEDLNGNTDSIRVGNQTIEPGSTISWVPFHFSVVVSSKAEHACANTRPTLNLTRLGKDSNPIRPGMLCRVQISGKTCSEFEKIERLESSKNAGVSVSEITYRDNGHYEATLSWRPSRNQSGFQRICVNVTQENGLTSENHCVSILISPELFRCELNGGQYFQTFDGHRFGFSSRCRLQLTTTFPNFTATSDPFVPFLNISVISRVDLESRISGVERVFITVDDLDFEMRRNGSLRLYGSRLQPPVRIRKVKIDSKGHGFLLTTKTEVSINYDGTSSLTLTLPQYYMGKVKGLCGNFNLDPADDSSASPRRDLVSPNRAEIDPRHLVDDLRCDDEEAIVVRDEASCGEEEQLRNSGECQLIVDMEGCFQGCHLAVDPIPFYESCLATLCDDENEIRRLQLSEYASACEQENTTICDWRQRLREVLETECPPHSHYTQCGASDPMTCTNLTEEVGEPSQCVAGCECDTGYVLSDEKCIPRLLCGCFIRGSYRVRGFVFRTDDCMHECTCIGQNKTSCSAAPLCDENERCRILRSGFAGCVSRARKLATCKVIGDPHYQTFDGAMFDSMSTCAHVLVKSREGSSVPQFMVVGINEAPTFSNMVSFVKEVQVSIGGENSVNVSLEQGKVLKVNGVLVNPGTRLRGVQFRMTSTFLVASFNFGLVIRWDGVDRLRISAWDSLMNQVEGLCGNYDGNPDNDFPRQEDEELIANVNRFVSSWLITGRDLNGNNFPVPPQNATEVCLTNGFTGPLLGNCEELFNTNENQITCRETRDDVSPCDEKSDELRNQYRKSCEILIDPNGPFSRCHAFSNPFPVFSSCFFDLCAYNGDSAIRERIISSYAIDCTENGVGALTWRNETGSNISCGRGSEPSQCLRQCEATCADLDGEKCRADPDIDEYCEEGCSCSEGFVRSSRGNECVQIIACGCVINDVYQERGFTFRRNNCRELCVCVGGGVVNCSATESCDPQETCISDGFGFQDCIETLQEKGLCMVEISRKITTFDGATYNATGLCSHIVARNAARSETPQFSVAVVQEPGDRQQSEPANLFLSIRFGENSTLQLFPRKIVRLNGTNFNSSYADDELQVVISDELVAAIFNLGLNISWDFKYGLNISASSRLRQHVEGLCGNFDGIVRNDTLSSSGAPYPSISDFIASWMSDDYGVSSCAPSPISDSTDSSLQKFITLLRQNTSVDESDTNNTTSVCSYTWTDWMDRDDPDGSGDDESLARLQEDYPDKICRNPLAIEARLSDGRPATLSGNDVRMGSDLGLTCVNNDQQNQPCADFKVRFLCFKLGP